MTPNKIRDELAAEFCFEKRKYNPRSAGTTCYMEGFEDAFTAAEKQYLGEIEGLKFKLMDRSEKYKIAMDKGVMELSDQIESLKADLEIAVSALEKMAQLIMFEPSNNNKIGKWDVYDRVLNLINKTLCTLKSKLGRGEK